MAPHHAARLRLVALGEAVFLRATVLGAAAVYALRLVTDNVYAAYSPSILGAWLGLSAVPALVMAPVFGVVAGSRWNWRVQLGGSLFVLALVLAAAAGAAIPWLSLAGAMALEAAAFAIAVLGNLAAVTHSTRLRMPLVTVWFGLSAAGGALLGAIFGLKLAGPLDPSPLASACAIAMGGALLGVLIGRFPVPPVPLSAGIVRPFAAGTMDVGRTRLARAAVVGLWFWGFLLALFLVAVLRAEVWVIAVSGVHLDDALLAQLRAFGWAFLGGLLVAALARHPFRHGAFALYGATAGVGCALWLALAGPAAGPVVGLGLSFGASLTALLALAFVWTKPPNQGVAAALVVIGWAVGALALAAVLAALGPDPLAARRPLVTILVVVAAVAALGAWLRLFRPALETTAEILLWPIYRISRTGPGVAAMPARGPYLVIANHAAWLDPLFLAKAVEAPIIPMMTSKFFDLPVIAFLMRVIGTIRVPDSAYRREAPELKDAVRALDAGEALVIFPEGYLRRKEEVPLKRFGRGVWKVLYDRPDTPIFACWIEGAWESYTSFKGGPPTKNKRLDFWRRIRIRIRGPFRLDPAVLADHMATRTALMQEVALAREPLGLAPLTPVAGPEGDEE